MSNSETMQKRILLVIRHGNQGDATLKEALDMAMVSAAFGQSITLLFVEEGVYHWVKNQKTDFIGVKPYCKALEALALYDVDQVYLCQESLLARQQSLSYDTVQSLGQSALIDLMERSDVIIDY